jgi:hypothetical protein
VLEFIFEKSDSFGTGDASGAPSFFGYGIVFPKFIYY